MKDLLTKDNLVTSYETLPKSPINETLKPEEWGLITNSWVIECLLHPNSKFLRKQTHELINNVILLAPQSR